MEDKRLYKPRKSGAGRKSLKPNYDSAAILQEHKYDRQLFDKPLFVFKNFLLIYNRVVDKMKVVYLFYESVIIKKPKKVNV
ncbi:hypothetical protein ACTQXP_08595 [Holdemanella porci]|uniref:hypothetical protein n=1 Tax=Holdemanella porci TaxID=2652276 RepID=UPI003F934B6E